MTDWIVLEVKAATEALKKHRKQQEQKKQDDESFGNELALHSVPLCGALRFSKPYAPERFFCTRRIPDYRRCADKRATGV